MKCPVLSISLPQYIVNREDMWCDCLKEECAWWDEVVEQCSIKTLARGIVPIINDLKELVRKMPHEGQFRK